MGFLEHYVDKHRLDTMPQKHKNNINKLEKSLSKRIPDSANFDEVLQKYGPQISDLVERVAKAFGDGFSFSDFRVVINIGVEVYQLVNQISDQIVSPGMSPEEQHEARVEFGKDLTYLIWMTVDPLKKYFNWLPFKKTIERKLVKWLAGYALDAAMDIITANTSQVNAMAAGTSLSGIRGLP